jgi:predicted nucleotidyltransferase
MANDKVTKGPSTEEARQREFVYILDEKIDVIRKGYVNELRYDTPRSNGGMRTREFAWLLGEMEFHMSYHELPEAIGSARYRIRVQAHQLRGVGDNWVDLLNFGELDGLLRAEKKKRVLTASDLKAEQHKHVHEGETPDGLILVGLSGSRAYGLSHNGYKDPESGEDVAPSDIDIRGIFVTNTRNLLMMGDNKNLIEQKKDADTVYNEVKKFMELCIMCNPERLELLATCHNSGVLVVNDVSAYLKGHPHADFVLEKNYGIVSTIGKLLIDNRDMFLSRRLIKTYGGYAKQQLMRIERKEERRSKPAMHLIRLMITGLYALNNCEVNPDMSEYRESLLAIRTGAMPLEDVIKWHQELEAEFAKAIETTKLPEHADMDRINTILLQIRRENLVW